MPQCGIMFNDFDDPVTVTDCVIMNFPFNRNSWTPDQSASSKKTGLLRQSSFEKSHSPSPVAHGSSPLSQEPAQMLRHNHSLKYSGGALHGDPSLPQGFDHNFSQERFIPDEQLQQRFLLGPASHISS